LHSISISDEAKANIDGITAYTKASWGWRQADKYLSQLEEAFDRLAERPLIGRSCDRIRPGLRRFEVGKHVIFYYSRPNGIRISRILQQQMMPTETRFKP